MRWRLLCVLGIACLLPLAYQPASLGQAAAKDGEAERLVESAKKLAVAKKFAEAAATMKRALALAPKNDLYLALASDFEREAGLFAEGLSHAQQALALNDKVGAYHVLAAANAFGNQDIKLARRYTQTVLKGGVSKFGPGPVSSARTIESMVVKKTLTIVWELDPRKGVAVKGAYQVALPKGDLPYQSSKYKLTGAKSSRVVKTEANDVLNIVPQGTRPVQLVTTVTVEPFSYKKRLAERKAGALPASVRPYLGPGVAIDPASPKVTKVAKGLKSGDSIHTVNGVLGWMKKNITYKSTKKFIDVEDFKSVDELLDRGHAECRGYTLLFVALCRAAGVPARSVWGIYVPPSHRGFANHNWAEVYISGVGWVPVDPQLPETFGMLPTTHVRLFMDHKRRGASGEDLPQVNLLYMNGNDLKYEVKAEELGGASSP